MSLTSSQTIVISTETEGLTVVANVLVGVELNETMKPYSCCNQLIDSRQRSSVALFELVFVSYLETNNFGNNVPAKI